MSLPWIMPLFVALWNGEPEGQEQQVFALAREAFSASVHGLHSGIGKGTFRKHLSAQGRHDDVAAELTVYLDAGKYHIRLDYEPPVDGLTREILIYDGADVIHARFSERYTPTGCDVAVRSSHSGTGFPNWNPWRLAAELFDFEAAGSTVKESDIAFRKVSTDGYEGRYKLANVTVKLSVDAKFGFNVSRVQAFNGADVLPAQTVSASYGKSDELWYVKSLSIEMGSRKPNQDSVQLIYDEFKVNVPVPAEVFTIAALEIPDGTRVADRRPNTPHDKYIFAEPRQSDLSRVDSLIETVKQLPKQGSRPKANASSRRDVYIVNAAALLAISIALMICRWRRRAALTTS